MVLPFLAQLNSAPGFERRKADRGPAGVGQNLGLLWVESRH